MYLAQRVSKYLAKCTAIVDSANMVMRLASYRNLCPVFNTPCFEVKLVSCRSERHPRTGSLAFWKTLFDITPEPDILVPFWMHPECALLEYHHNSLYSARSAVIGDTPVPQIGTSNDPCHACKTFFSTYKDKPSNFSLHMCLSTATRDVSLVCDDLWLPPRLESAGYDLERRFANLLLDEYRIHRVIQQEGDCRKQDRRCAAFIFFRRQCPCPHA